MTNMTMTESGILGYPPLVGEIQKRSTAIPSQRMFLEEHVNRLRDEGGKWDRLCCSIRHTERLGNA